MVRIAPTIARGPNWRRGGRMNASSVRVTDAQREFLWRFSEVGGHTCVAEGLDRALAVLEQWQILPGRAS